MATKYRVWTEEDMDKLRELAASGKSYDEIAQEMGRTVAAIRARTFTYKIIVFGAEKRIWTPEEDEYLRENWGQSNLTSMKKALHRTEVAIKQRACNVLRLGRADELTDYVKIAEFASLSSISRDRIVNTLVPKHKFPVVRKIVLNNRQYFVDLGKVLKWMEAHQVLFDGSRVSEDLFVPEPEWLTEKRIQDRENKEHVHSHAIVKLWTHAELMRLKDLVHIGSDFIFLRDHWKTMTDEELAVHLHKSKTAIIKQRNNQGYLRVKEKRRYTQEEECFIQENWQKMSDKEMSEHLGRTVGGVKNLRYKLGLPYLLECNSILGSQIKVCKRDIVKIPRILEWIRYVLQVQGPGEKGSSVVSSRQLVWIVQVVTVPNLDQPAPRYYSWRGIQAVNHSIWGELPADFLPLCVIHALHGKRKLA